MFGQMSFKKISTMADYLQLDICGLSAEASEKKYLNYNSNIPVILHGDWSKKGANENNLKIRKKEYIETILRIQRHTKVLGITIHPPTRSTMDVNEVISIFEEIFKLTGVMPFLENRSNSKYLLSKPDEVISFSKKALMTLDVPQFFIACGYNEALFYKSLYEIEWSNVKEIHVGNIKTLIDECGKRRSNVAQKLENGILEFEKIKPFLRDIQFVTIEILGDISTFENEIIYLKK